MFTARTDLSGLNSLVFALKGFAKNDALKIAATDIISDVKRKTKAGVDPQGTAFKPYQPRYKKVRERKHLQTDHVDLTDTKGMLDSLQYKKAQRIVTVGDKQQKKAEGLNFGVPSKNVAPRPFMAEPGSDTTKKIENDVARALRQIRR